MRNLSSFVLASLLLGGCLVTPVGGAGTVPPPAPGEAAPAPTTLSGVVVDSVTHAPLARVGLDFAMNGRGVGTAVTDESGHYQTPVLSPGVYAIRLRREAYAPQQQPNISIHAGSNEMNFEMVRVR